MRNCRTRWIPVGRWPMGAGPRSAMLAGGGLKARVVEVRDHERCGDAIDSEKVPAARFQPAAEPPECEQTGEKCKDHAEKAGCGGRQYSGELMMLRLIQAPYLARIGRWREHDREGKAEVLGAAARHARQQAGRDGRSGAGKAAEG